MRVIVSGGGTGGHINPAIAIAKYIMRKESSSEILFCGGTGGLEEKLVPREGFAIKTIEIRGFRRDVSPKGLKYNINSLKTAYRSLDTAKRYIREFKPDIVVGCGGYASYPIVRAAQKLNIPTVLLEVNALPGMTTKVLARHADAVMVSFEETMAYFKKNAVLTGSPVREDILFSSREKARRKLAPDGRPLILSVWGSLGAEKMNRYMADFIRCEAKENAHYIIHAIGSYGYDWMPDLIRKKGVNLDEHPNIDVRSYIYDMADALAAADLVLCRAGASTLGELQALGKPAIIVPSPNVAENHQEKNARALEKIGAAVVQLESETDGEKLFRTANELLNNRDKLLSMSAAMKSAAIYDAPQRIYDTIHTKLKSSIE